MSDGSGYQEAIEALEVLARQPVLPARTVGLARARRLLAEVGDPHRSFRAVHVTGSSGKGSTTTMIGSILEAAGFRTGYLRSPHLSSYTERIAIGSVSIPEATWARYWSRLQPVVEAMTANSIADYELGRPSFSEAIFAIAALYFRDSGVEWAALEAGLGGRYDATNVVESDVAVITTVSLEHTQVLGTTVTAIAGEKAAIIKPGCAAVTGARSPDALAVIEERSREVGARLWRVPADVSYQLRSSGLSGTEIAINLGDNDLVLRLALLGTFQAENAAVAAAASLALRDRGVLLDRSHIAIGLERARLPGRLEVVERDPLVILDGAHHPAAVRALRVALGPLLHETPVTVLFTALRDKDIAAMAREVEAMASSVILTTAPGTPRAVPPNDLAEYFGEGARVVRVDDPAEALEVALQATRREGVLLVCGSLYLVGFVRDILLRSRIAS